MKRKFSNKTKSGPKKGTAAPFFAKPATPFWQKPGGTFLLCALLYGLIVWTFLPALHCGFLLFDDVPILVKNPHVNTGLSWANVRSALFSLNYSYSYPLDQISHMLDFTIFGKQPWGHHLTNVLLHAANGVLLFLVFRRMTGAFWRSFLAALLFAVHPLRVESVAWVSERKDVLCAFFGLLALWMYIRHAEEARRQGGRTKLFYSLSLLFFLFALMSKSMVVTLPCVMLLLDYWPLKRFPDYRFPISVSLRLLVEKIPFFVLVALECVVTWFSSKAGEGTFILHLPWPMRLETAVIGYERYIGLMFWPAKLSAMYPYPDHWPVGQLLFATALFIVMSALAWVWRRQRPYWMVGWLWYVGTLVPAIGLIPLGGESICTRFTYIPMMGALLLFVWGVEDFSKRWRQRGAVITAVAAFAAALCVIQTRGEIGYWKNSETLYRRAIAVTTNNFMAHYCLATVLSHSNPAEELKQYQESVDIYPDYENAQRELGVIEAHYGRYAEAGVHFKKAIQLNPRDGWNYHNLAVVDLKTGHLDKVIPLLMKATETDRANPSHKNMLNSLMFFRGQIHPYFVSNFLATARSDPAGCARFLGTLQSDTNHLEFIYNLALAFAIAPDAQLRNGNHAVRLATLACQMTKYRDSGVVTALALADAEDSRFDAAITNAQLACHLAAAAGQTNQLDHTKTLLKLFRSHQAYHESGW